MDLRLKVLWCGDEESVDISLSISVQAAVEWWEQSSSSVPVAWRLGKAAWAAARWWQAGRRVRLLSSVVGDDRRTDSSKGSGSVPLTCTCK